MMTSTDHDDHHYDHNDDDNNMDTIHIDNNSTVQKTKNEIQLSVLKNDSAATTAAASPTANDMESLLPHDDDDYDDDPSSKRRSLEALLPQDDDDNVNGVASTGNSTVANGNSGLDGDDATILSVLLSGTGPLARYVQGANERERRTATKVTPSIRTMNSILRLVSGLPCCFGSGGSGDDSNGNKNPLQIRPYRIGNMTILFPEHFDTGRGWGVLGPHSHMGPTCVWLLLVLATHMCLHGVYRHNLGVVSAAICYLFFGLCTWRLTDVSLRDPGIVMFRDRPDNATNDDYRFCDRCRVWQPPDGIHCPESGCCIAGYDHYCVWMGTCIGKRNYRAFVLFNMSWLYYVMYAFFWILTFGPMIMNRHHS